MATSGRFRCLEVIRVQWETAGAPRHGELAVLHEIWRDGGLFQVDAAAAPGTSVVLTLPRGEVAGTVRSCIAEEGGYILDVHIDSAEEWLAGRYRPEVLLPCDTEAEGQLPMAS